MGLLARYRDEGAAVFEPRSRRPDTNPNATPLEVVDLIVRLRKELAEQGLDAGPETITWHLAGRSPRPRHRVPGSMTAPGSPYGPPPTTESPVR